MPIVWLAELAPVPVLRPLFRFGNRDPYRLALVHTLCQQRVGDFNRLLTHLGREIRHRLRVMPQRPRHAVLSKWFIGTGICLPKHVGAGPLIRAASLHFVRPLTFHLVKSPYPARRQENGNKAR